MIASHNRRSVPHYQKSITSSASCKRRTTSENLHGETELPSAARTNISLGHVHGRNKKETRFLKDLHTLTVLTTEFYMNAIYIATESTLPANKLYPLEVVDDSRPLSFFFFPPVAFSLTTIPSLVLFSKSAAPTSEDAGALPSIHSDGE